jgi:hypothetical protein
MKKETLLLIGFWLIVGGLIFYAVKLLKETQTAINVSKEPLQV